MESNIFYEVLVTHGQVALGRPDHVDADTPWDEEALQRGYMATHDTLHVAVPDHEGLCAIAFSPQVPQGAIGPISMVVGADGLIIRTFMDNHAVPVAAGPYNAYFIIKDGNIRDNNDARYGQAVVFSLQAA